MVEWGDQLCFSFLNTGLTWIDLASASTVLQKQHFDAVFRFVYFFSQFADDIPFFAK